MTFQGTLLVVLAAAMTVTGNLMMREGVVRAGGLSLGVATMAHALMRLARQPFLTWGGLVCAGIAGLVSHPVHRESQQQLPLLVSVTFISSPWAHFVQRLCRCKAGIGGSSASSWWQPPGRHAGILAEVTGDFRTDLCSSARHRRGRCDTRGKYARLGICTHTAWCPCWDRLQYLRRCVHRKRRRSREQGDCQVWRPIVGWDRNRG